jgi:hypothetical protein
VALAVTRASFNSPTPHLQPLPICGLFYRWGCDLFGPLPATTDGYRYVMVPIEHLSKHIELVPLQDKTSGSTARAIAAAVLGRFGAPAEVLTDRGSEWGGKIEELLLQCMIDVRPSWLRCASSSEARLPGAPQGLRLPGATPQLPNPVWGMTW